MGIRCADHATPSIRKKLTLTSPKSGGRSVGIVRLRTKSHGVCCFVPLYTVPERLVDVTELVNIANARAHWQSPIYQWMMIGLGTWIYSGSAGGSNLRLAADHCKISHELFTRWWSCDWHISWNWLWRQSTAINVYFSGTCTIHMLLPRNFHILREISSPHGGNHEDPALWDMRAYSLADIYRFFEERAAPIIRVEE
jgi:hypothetical protein